MTKPRRIGRGFSLSDVWMWHEADVSSRPAEVRCRGKTGRDLLDLSLSASVLRLHITEQAPQIGIVTLILDASTCYLTGFAR